MSQSLLLAEEQEGEAAAKKRSAKETSAAEGDQLDYLGGAIEYVPDQNNAKGRSSGLWLDMNYHSVVSHSSLVTSFSVGAAVVQMYWGGLKRAALAKEAPLRQAAVRLVETIRRRGLYPPMEVCTLRWDGREMKRG